MPTSLGFSTTALKLRESITHGTKAKIAALNETRDDANQIIDLSIGTLDVVTDKRIDQYVINAINGQSELIHEFAPVKGFAFLRTSIANHIQRLRDCRYEPEREILVSPGGIKGAITVFFHTILNFGDEVIFPVPNWPHYSDMIELHGAVPVPVMVPNFYTDALDPKALEQAITESTKVVILGDCINPSGKIYSHTELEKLCAVIARNNIQRSRDQRPPTYVLFDCPYEAHILKSRPLGIADFKIEVSGETYCMRDCSAFVTGPGKTYGMHGDRLGYLCAAEPVIDMAQRVQVNLNSFASTYAQFATHAAMKPEMDDVARKRARSAHENLHEFVDALNSIPGVKANIPDGGYFIFVDFSAHALALTNAGYARADQYLIEQAGVATISGLHFAENVDELKWYVRMNCGRSAQTLLEAAARIECAL
jgi:aspartate aminotransferase/aspartate/glutamate/aspartate-prephenate aminotransferase